MAKTIALGCSWLWIAALLCCAGCKSDRAAADATKRATPRLQKPPPPPPPPAVKPDALLTTVALGSDHGCAVRKNGRVVCWGNNDHGQLGNGSRGEIAGGAPPSDVPGLADVAQLAAGVNHTCAVRANGEVRCWGTNWGGQLGNGKGGGGQAEPRPVKVTELPPALQVDCMWSHSCAVLRSGGVACWGSNDAGQLGDGGGAGATNSGQSGRPVIVPDLEGVTQVAVGQGFSCALVKGGEVRCWGSNRSGQLGRANAPSRVPVTVGGLGKATQIGAGMEHVCALLAGGELRCWGANSQNQLGIEDDEGGPPVKVLDGVKSFALGSWHSCAVRQPAEVLCWGSAGDGQIGDRTCRTRGGAERPTRTAPLPAPPAALAAGHRTSCALLSDGWLWCWGSVTHGIIRVPHEDTQDCRDTGDPNRRAATSPMRFEGLP